MPSREELVFDGDATKVIQAIKQVVEAEEKLKKEIKQTSKAAKEGNDQAFDAWQRQKSELRKIGKEHARLRGELDKLGEETEDYGNKGKKAGLLIKGVLVGGVSIAIKKIIDLQAEYNRELAESVRRQDEVGRKLRVQALLSDEEYQKQILPRVGRAANRSAVSLEEAQTVATELVSQGFSKDEATGAALEELLLGAVATNTDDKKAFSTAIASFIKSQGRELTQENVRDVTIPLAAMFEGTAIQGGDLTALSQIGSLMKEFGVSQQSGFAAFDVLKNVGTQPEKAATALRNMVQIMSTAKADKNISAVLEEIGGPDLADRIDLVGENFPTALANLAEALSTLDESSKKQALSKIFGREVSAPAATILGNLDTMGEFLDLQRSDEATATYRQLIERGTSGVAARQTRIANDKQLREFRQGQEEEERESVAQLIEERMLETGSTPHAAGMAKKTFTTMAASFDLLNAGGMIDERNVGEILNKIPGLNRDDRTAILQKLGRYKGGTEVDTSGFFDGEGRFTSKDSERTKSATYSPFFMNSEGKPIFDNSQVPKLGGTEGSEQPAGRKIDFTRLGEDGELASLEMKLKEKELEKKKLEYELEEAKKPQAVIDRQTEQLDRMIELLEIQISEAQLKKLRNRNSSE